MKKGKKIVGIIFLITVAAALLYIGVNVYSLIKYAALTSFPWWSAFVFAGIYFGPLLCVEGIVYGILHFVEKNRSGEETL